MNFSGEIKSIQNVLASEPHTSSWRITDTKSLKPNMMELAERSPLGVILQAWDGLESAVFDYAKQITEINFNNSGMAIEYLTKNNKLPENYLNLFYRLMALKTRFSNFENESLPKERALEYSDTVLSITDEINKITLGIINLKS